MNRADRDLARTPQFGPLVLHGLGAIALAVSGAVALYLFLAWLLGVSPHLAGTRSGQPALPIADQQKLLADLVKVALGLAAGIGAAFALVVSYRRARTEEASSHRDDRRLFSSRYQDAADLIGSDKAAVRLAGVYALARLADDWEEQRQQCIDVLCAYLRLPYDPQPDGGDFGEREVRYSVIGLISSHLQPAASPSWRGHNFDFNGALFDGGDFRYAEFAGGTVNFRGATFNGTVDFTGATFRGDVNFRGAKFTSGEVSFVLAKFTFDEDSSTVHFIDRSVADFTGAEFTGGTVNFSGAAFIGLIGRTVADFTGAEFSGGTVDFGGAAFIAGIVEFTNAKFLSGAVDFIGHFIGGTVNFSAAEFAGSDVDFSGAAFAGSDVYFSRAKFTGGQIRFTGAEFTGGTVRFDGAAFAGSHVHFGNARFTDGTVDLRNTHFTTGTLDLPGELSADGIEPEGLPMTPTAGLLLPDWLTSSP